MKKSVKLILSAVAAMALIMGCSMCAFASPAVISSFTVSLPATYDGQSTDDFMSGISVTCPEFPGAVTVNITTGVYPQGSGYIGGSVDTLREGVTYTLWLDLISGDHAFKSGVTSSYTYPNAEFWKDFDGTVNGISCRYALVEDYDKNHMRIACDFTVGGNNGGSSSDHTHIFEYRVITEPSIDCDGVEGEVCTICGETRNVQGISAFAYTMNYYLNGKINTAKPGQTVVLECGEWNSFPKSVMEKVAEKSAQNVTFVFKYKYNHQPISITIPAGSKVNTELKWYGPAKMIELYGMN